MRPAVLVTVLLVGVTAAGCGAKKKTSVSGTPGKCPPVAAASSAGNAQLNAQALGGRYSKSIVIHAKEKSSGAPIHGGDVTIQAAMACPDVMHLYEKKLQETAPGTYKTGYTLVMPGTWTFSVVLRAKNGDATTGTFPVTVKAPGT